MPAATIDEYLAGLTPERRAVLEDMRTAVGAGAPGASEAIAYGMPALRSSDGQFVLSYDAYKKHVSLFPASDVVVAEVGEPLARHLTGKGTISFPSAEPLPLELITEIARIRWSEVQARAQAPGRRPRRPSGAACRG